MAAVRLWLSTAWAWLKRNWKWLLLPVGVVLYVIGRLSAKKDITVMSPELTGHQEVNERLNTEAIEKKQQADQKASAELSAIETERASTATTETQKQVKEIEEVQGDPGKVTDLLKRIGKDIREGKK